jgi:hypothetical protein
MKEHAKVRATFIQMPAKIILVRSEEKASKVALKKLTPK